MKHIYLLIVLSLLFVQVASADAAIPGTKSISYCSVITNADSFTDYHIVGVILGPIGKSATIIHDNECYSLGYKFNSGGYYAIKKTDYSLLKNINHTMSENDEDTIEYLVRDWDAYHSFFEELIDNGTLLDVPILLRNIHTTSLMDPRTSITDTYTLEGDINNLTVSKRRSTTQDHRYYLLLIISAAALIGIFIELYNRRTQP